MTTLWYHTLKNVKTVRICLFLFHYFYIMFIKNISFVIKVNLVGHLNPIDNDNNNLMNK